MSSTLNYINNHYLDSMRLVGDPPADALIAEIFSTLSDARVQEILAFIRKPNTVKWELWPVELLAFVREHIQLPEWADWRVLRKAAEFYRKHKDNIRLMLGLYSLPYCYAAAKGVQVLYASARLRNDTLQRLQETADFVDYIAKPRAFTLDKTEKNYGMEECLRIRLLHAISRYFCLTKTKWNMELGYPINQEDMAGTNLAFSFIVTRGLRKMNLAHEPEKSLAWLHLWNVVGWYMGISPNLICHTATDAFELDFLIAKRQFAPSQAGHELTAKLVETLQANVPDPKLSHLTIPYMQYLLGDEISKILNLPNTGTGFQSIELLRYANGFKSIFAY